VAITLLFGGRKKMVPGGGVQFRVYDSAVLRQIHNWRSESAGAKDNLIGATEISGFAIPFTLDDGLNRVILPQEFAQDAETLDAAGLNRSD